jgi:hypothetical protein
LVFDPQHLTLPVCTAQRVYNWPEIRVTPEESPVTSCGDAGDEVVPLPYSPSQFDPQQRTPPAVVSTQVENCDTVTAEAPDET